MVVPVLQRMSSALTQAGRALQGLEQSDGPLRPLIDHFAEAPDRLLHLQEAAMTDGACLVLARLRASHPEISTYGLVNTVLEGRPSEGFFEEVTKVALLVTTDSRSDV